MEDYIKRIPPHTLASIERYVMKGIPTGDFLYGVLTNDLGKTMWHGDAENLRALPDIWMYVYNRIPAACWGSKEKVAAWHEERRKEGPLDTDRNLVRLVP